MYETRAHRRKPLSQTAVEIPELLDIEAGAVAQRRKDDPTQAVCDGDNRPLVPVLGTQPDEVTKYGWSGCEGRRT